MQDLTEKNTHLSQELQECKAQREAALATAGGATEQYVNDIRVREINSCICQ